MFKHRTLNITTKDFTNIKSRPSIPFTTDSKKPQTQHNLALQI